MADAIRRAHARITIDREVEVWLGAARGRLIGPGRLLDISLAGAQLHFLGELQPNSPYHLKLNWPEGAVELPFRVVRVFAVDAKKPSAGRRYGLSFNLTTDQEAALRVLLDKLRQHPASDQDKRFDRSLKDYWSS